MVKKLKNLRFGEKKNLSSSKTGESVGNAKQSIFHFWPDRVRGHSKKFVEFLHNFFYLTSNRFQIFTCVIMV